MKDIKFENVNKGLCVMCDKNAEISNSWICLKCGNFCETTYSKPLEEYEDKMLLDIKSGCCNTDVKFLGRITCSEECHEDFITACEYKFGKVKTITDTTTNMTYEVPTRDIIEKGIKWEDLPTYPLYSDEKSES